MKENKKRGKTEVDLQNAREKLPINQNKTARQTKETKGKQRKNKGKTKGKQRKNKGKTKEKQRENKEKTKKKQRKTKKETKALDARMPSDQTNIKRIALITSLQYTIIKMLIECN